MAYTTKISQILENTVKSATFFDIFAAFLIGGSVFLFAVFFKYALRRHKMSRYFPSKHVSFFSLLGNVDDVIRVNKITKEITVTGYKIPKGTECTMSIFHLHRDENVFPDPEKFDPDRFLPENSANRHPFAYIPFSAGPRNCIGQRFAIMEEKVVVANILRNFTLESLDPREKVPLSVEIILRTPKPIRIKIRPRKAG